MAGHLRRFQGIYGRLWCVKNRWNPHKRQNLRLQMKTGASPEDAPVHCFAGEFPAPQNSATLPQAED